MALINLRNALMSGKRLPYDAEVEYLESTGMQWIDTGVYGNSDTVAELTFAMTDNSRLDAGIFGSRKAYRDDCFCILRVQASSGAFWMHYGDEGTSANYISTVIGNTTDWHVARLAKSWSIDNSSGTAGNYTFTTPTTLKLFAADMSASSRWYAKCRVSRLRIYSNGVLVRDFIPVRKGTVGYLYDRVSGKLFGNAGTGDFVLGQDVVPVEYIESHGTEWIDTGVAATGATNSELQFKMSIAGFAFGARTAWNASAYSLNYAAGNYAFNYGNNSVVADLKTSIRIDTNWHTAKIQSGGVLSLDEWTGIAGTFSFTTNGSLILFGTRQGSSLNLTASAFKYCKIWESSISVRSFRSVRVGTEGAMMDVLTRRIYRNAGTGAFTYGNDLKYPIPAS